MLGVVYLLAEHSAHVAAFLPFIVILACPLLHLFMHRGHGDHGDDQAHNARIHRRDRA